MPSAYGGPGTGPNQLEFPDDQEPNQIEQDVEQLTSDVRKEAQPLIDAFGEMTVRKLFSKTWQNRDQAVEDIEQIVLADRSVSAEEAFANSMGAVRYLVADKMSAVGQKAMHLFSAVTNTYPNVNLTGGFRNQFAGYADFILSNLSDKIGDNL